MRGAVRYDVGELRKPERTAQGFLRADAVLTRSGVFAYRNPDGSVRREYRPPEEVFRADSLASFEDAPVTLGHPARLLDTETAKAHTRGWCKEVPRRDGTRAVSRLLISDRDAIAAIENGSASQVSLGYRVDYDPTPGVTPEGERYDGVQRNILGNHIALVGTGRAGPEAAVFSRFDAADAAMVSEAETKGLERPNPQEKPAMATKIRIDSVDYEATEQLAQAFAASEQRSKARIDELTVEVKTAKTEAEKAAARADQAEADAKKAKQEREDALRPDELNKRVKARVALEKKASEVLGETKMDAMTDAQIKRAVVEKLHPDAKARLDGANDVYLEARYDAAIEAWDARPNKSLGDVRRDAGNTGGGDNDAAKRIAAARNDQANAWKKGLEEKGE